MVVFSFLAAFKFRDRVFCGCRRLEFLSEGKLRWENGFLQLATSSCVFDTGIRVTLSNDGARGEDHTIARVDEYAFTMVDRSANR